MAACRLKFNKASLIWEQVSCGFNPSHQLYHFCPFIRICMGRDANLWRSKICLPPLPCHCTVTFGVGHYMQSQMKYILSKFAFIIEMTKQSLSVTKNVQNVPEIVHWIKKVWMLKKRLRSLVHYLIKLFVLFLSSIGGTCPYKLTILLS